MKKNAQDSILESLSESQKTYLRGGNERDRLRVHVDELQAENARLQTRVEEADEVMGLAVAALNERVQEVDLLKRERDDYKALAKRLNEALDAWVRYSLSSKPSKELLAEALRLTDAAEEPR